MSRRYHRFVGGKAINSPTRTVRQAGAEWFYGGSTGPLHIPAHCCPDVPPWERCEHQEMRRVLKEMRT